MECSLENSFSDVALELKDKQEPLPNLTQQKCDIDFEEVKRDLNDISLIHENNKAATKSDINHDLLIIKEAIHL